MGASLYLLSSPMFRFGGYIGDLPLSWGLILFCVSGLFWTLLAPPFGILMTLFFTPFLWVFVGWTDAMATEAMIPGVPSNIVVFVLINTAGWACLLLGHAIEGQRPAFLDDLVQGLLGPTFLVYELLKPIGLCRGLVSIVDDRIKQTAPPEKPPSSA